MFGVINMSYILLNTNRYKDNVLLKTNDNDILVKSQNLLKEEKCRKKRTFDFIKEYGIG